MPSDLLTLGEAFEDPDALRLGNRIGALSTRQAGGLDGLPHPGQLRTLSG